jgi:hypothetical protein
VNSGTRITCVNEPTGLTFQFASVSKCMTPAGSPKWQATGFGSEWFCAFGALCGADPANGCCDANEQPDNPETGTRQSMNQTKCEMQATGNSWTVGSTNACINLNADSAPHPSASSFVNATQCTQQVTHHAPPPGHIVRCSSSTAYPGGARPITHTHTHTHTQLSGFTFTATIPASCTHNETGAPMMMLVQVAELSVHRSCLVFVSALGSPIARRNAGLARPSWRQHQRL